MAGDRTALVGRAVVSDDASVLDGDDAIGVMERAVVVGDRHDSARRVLETSFRSSMTALPFSLSSAAVGLSASTTEGRRQRAGDGIRCFSPPELRGIGTAMAETDRLQRLGRGLHRIGGARVTHVEGDEHVLERGQGREQVVALNTKPMWRRRMSPAPPTTFHRLVTREMQFAAGGGENAAEDREQCRLLLPDGPIRRVSLRDGPC